MSDLTWYRVERILREFSWGNYGLDEVEIALSDDPEAQEWVGDLAAEIAEAIVDDYASRK